MIVIEQPGLLSTVQDLGRPGLQHLGITPGGAMDRFSAVIANALVGNPAGAAVLEMTLVGPRLRFLAGCWVAITGADLAPSVADTALPGWRPVWLPAGSELHFGAARQGCRAYLAVAGGIQVPEVLGSRSTDCRAGFGGVEGRPLRGGDRLAVGLTDLPALPETHGIWSPRWCVDPAELLAATTSAVIRLVPGADWVRLSEPGRRALASGAHRVSHRSDRMGLRLEGPELSLTQQPSRLSAGVSFGTLQLPPGGQPILLGADRQTTGGYPVLGTIASVDWPKLAQLRPGQAVSIVPIDLAMAQALLRKQKARLQRLYLGLAARWPLETRNWRGRTLDRP